jgi:RNA polymerase sigma-70 factor (ECF subfamily)
MAMNDQAKVRDLRTQRSGNESDAPLLERIAAGDHAALHELYLAYYHRVLRFVMRITGSLELAQEGVNDVMLTVWQSSTSFERRSSVSTWIMGIAYHKALKLLDAKNRWSSRFGSNIEDFEDRPELGVEPSEHDDLRDALDRALGELSPEQRAVVELTYFHGCSYEEIARIAGCPVNTVKTRMFHARAKLRRLLPALTGDEPAVE